MATEFTAYSVWCEGRLQTERRQIEKSQFQVLLSRRVIQLSIQYRFMTFSRTQVAV